MRNIVWDFPLKKKKICEIDLVQIKSNKCLSDIFKKTQNDTIL